LLTPSACGGVSKWKGGWGKLRVPHQNQIFINFDTPSLAAGSFIERDVVAPERKIKNPIPAAPMNRDLRQATGHFGNFPQSHGIESPRFAKKRICIYHLNSSPLQAAGNSNLK